MDDAGFTIPSRGDPRPTGARCASAEALERLHRGTVPPDEAGLLGAHLARCPECRKVLEGIAGTMPATPSAEAAPGTRTKGVLDAILRAEPSPDPVREATPAIEGFDNFNEVGRGGMGVVWRAREVRLERTVAIKVLTEVAAFSPQARAIAETEARALARIAHPNIVRVFALAQSAGAPAIVMEWIDGTTLAARGAASPFPVRQAVDIVRDLAGAVAALHACGIVHGDITPANVLLTAGSPAVPKLIDFGLSLGDGGMAAAGPRGAVGTPAFMAPEQTGQDPSLGGVGRLSDVHGLGALLFWLLSGSAPYAAPTSAASLERAARGEALTITTLVPRLPADLASIVAASLARRPEDRYRTAEDLAADLVRFLEGRPVRARRAGVAERTIKWARRRPALAALVTGAVATAAAGVFGVVHHIRRLGDANRAVVAERDEGLAAAALARASFAKLTDSTAERFLSRGTALDAADRDHLRQVRDRYRDWPLGPDQKAALHFRAEGLVRTARLLERLGWLDDAIETARLAGDCIDEIDRRGIATPQELSCRTALMHAERTMLARSGRLDEAITTTREAIAALEARRGVDPTVARDVAVAAGDLGNLAGQAGRLDESRAAHESALAILDRLLAASPDDAATAAQSLTILYNAAIGPAFGKDPPARRRLLETLVDRATAGLDRFPGKEADFGRGLLHGLSAQVEDDLRDGRAEDALAKVRLRAATARRLSAETTARRDFLDESIHAAVQAFRCLATLGRPGDARDGLAEAEDLASTAVADEPAVMQRTWVLVDVLLSRAALEEACGSWSEAIRCHRRIAAVIRAWTPDGGPPVPFPVRAADALAEVERLEAEERIRTPLDPDRGAEGGP